MSAAPDAMASDPYFQLIAAYDPGRPDIQPEESRAIVHALRAEDPVHLVPGIGIWFVTRHDDVKRLFDDPEHTTADDRAFEHYQAPPEGSFLRWAADHNIRSIPQADHTRIRNVVSRAFSPRAIQRMNAQIEDVVERFAGPLRGRRGDTLDLLGDFTNPIPNAVISRLTGVPPEGDDEARFRDLAQTLVRGFFSFAPPEVRAQSAVAFGEMADWVRAMAKQRRANPQNDLISDLLRAQQQDEQLSDDEIVVLVSGLIGAGSETTALAGLVLVHCLLQHPQLFAALRSDAAKIPAAVSEMLRWGMGGPGGLPRYATRDFTLRGKEIRKGQMLMLSFAGANSDPEVYADPDVFDIGRDNRSLLSFGHGRHYCLGANLARQEMACMLQGLLGILTPESRIREDAMQYQPMGFFQRPTNLPVEIV